MRQLILDPVTQPVGSYSVFIADAYDELRRIGDATVHCVVTSPPFLGLRDYGVAPTAWPEVTYTPMPGLPSITVASESVPLGLEGTPEAFIAHLILIFREVRRVLRPDGNCWVELGDTWAASGGDRPTGGSTAFRIGRPAPGPIRPPRGAMKPKNLMGMPWRFALAMTSEGWYLRQEIVWHKRTTTPENVSDRHTTSHSRIFHFTRSRHYFFDRLEADAIDATSGRTVWSPKQRVYRGQHTATFHPELCERCIRPSTSRAGVCPACGAPRKRVVEREAWPDERRVQAARAIELYRASNLTPAHLEALRTVGLALGAGGRRAVRGAERSDSEARRLAAEAREVLGGYCREFVAGRRTTKGWVPTCDCGVEGSAASVVVDPFAGSGTVGATAIEWGCHAVLIDAAEEAAQAIAERCAGVAPRSSEVPAADVAGEAIARKRTTSVPDALDLFDTI